MEPLHIRTRLRSSAAIILFLAATGLSCSSSPPAKEKGVDPVDPLFEAYREGVAQAMREIRAGEPTIYSYGLHAPGGVEPRTGLPYKPVAGDAVSPDTMWRIRGHNDAVRAYKAAPASASSR